MSASTPTPTNEFQPYVPAEETPREFTFQAVALGTGLGLIFAASSLYLVLKVGMTVSASIPVSVLAITLFRALSKTFRLRQATILENNITQTAGSAGESIAFGVGVTMPALMLLGFGMDLPRVMLVSILGGLLGILAMIPLRRAFIVKMHGRPGQPGTLLYPEGTACAQVLISGEKGGSTGMTVFFGFFLAFGHKIITEGMALLVATVKLPFTFINKSALFAQEMASELLGVGYIIGYRTSAVMMAGAVLGYLIIIPLIYFIGESMPNAVPPGDKPIAEMDIKEIRNNYLLFIGAGCVATAGILSMLKTLPMIVRGIASSLGGIGGGSGGSVALKRTDRDLPMSVVLLGSLALILILTAFLALEVSVGMAALAGLLVVVFGFLFVTVSSRLTGEIGSSSNPISGMTVATLMLTCLIFAAVGMTSVTERVLALSIAAVVCIASSNGGTTAQSLKTGFLLGGTPKAGQYAILVGALISAMLIGGTLIIFNESKVVYSQKPENLPAIVLTKPEMDRLTQKESYKDKNYLIFDTRNQEINDKHDDYVPREVLAKCPDGRYLVDPDSGKLTWFKDSAIMGRLTQQDDGSNIKREFDAPKTQVMGIIINGVLKKELNWTMVGIGAMIALMLELCGVSALAFAVGVYVPIQFSVPIFLGGIVRWIVDRKYAKEGEAAIAAAGDDPAKKAAAELEALRKSETSPGVLLASGYIAGGSLAGVLLAFLAFSDNIPDDLATYQYSQVAVEKPITLEKATDEYTRATLGNEQVDRAKAILALNKKNEQLTRDERALLSEYAETTGKFAGPNKRVPYLWVTVPKGTILKLPENEPYTPSAAKTLKEIATELFKDPTQAKKLAEINSVNLKLTPETNPETVSVPAGTEIKVPKRYEVPEETTLAKVAATTLGRERKAKELFDFNENLLKLPAEVPVGATWNQPQKDLPAIIGFAVLVLLLGFVGAGYLFKIKE
jgi:putative OPT family oligopeptide transporter